MDGNSLKLAVSDEVRAANQKGLKPCFVYVRRSKKDEEGITLEYQATEAVRYAGDQALHVAHTFSVQESASRENRKTFSLMLELAARFGIRDLVFKNMDRMTRNIQDKIRIWDLIKSDRFRIHFFESRRIYDSRSTYDDDFISDVEVIIAKRLSSKLSHDTTRNHRFRAEAGLALRAPWGYAPFEKRIGRYLLSSDVRIRENLRFIFDTFDSNSLTLEELADRLNREGIKTPTGKKWKKTGYLHALLRNPFYCGCFRYNGRLVEGTQETYFSRGAYEARLQKLGTNYRGQRRRNEQYLLAGLLRCCCGRALTGETKKQRYVYYGHQCGHAGRRIYFHESALLDTIQAEASNLTFSRSLTRNLKILFRGTLAEYSRTASRGKAVLTRRIHTELQKKERLIDVLASGEIDDLVALNTKLNEINLRIGDLEVQRRMGEKKSLQESIRICDVVDDLRAFAKTLRDAPAEGKAEILRRFTSCIVFREEYVDFEWRRPFGILMRPVVFQLEPLGKSGVRTYHELCAQRDSNSRPLDS